MAWSWISDRSMIPPDGKPHFGGVLFTQRTMQAVSQQRAAYSGNG